MFFKKLLLFLILLSPSFVQASAIRYASPEACLQVAHGVYNMISTKEFTLEQQIASVKESNLSREEKEFYIQLAKQAYAAKDPLEFSKDFLTKCLDNQGLVDLGTDI